ncbi:MAG: glucosidase [Verrucomicrobia bacterium]|nr:glucosidase [Verrucomicrobiota bacterium]
MKESERLEEANGRRAPWRRWGPYLSERQWGTVREDYSPNGTAWNYLTHDQARSRAYRWGEDGIAGLSDDHQRLCLSLALWNGKDPILKERLFGLTNAEGNHGEDVKELYYYLDASPTHSYLKMLYKYPQGEFPYAWLVKENARRGKLDPEFELIDTGAFRENRYFDVFVEYAKATPEDILIQITVCNRGPENAPIHLLQQLWFRNTWSWGRDPRKPSLEMQQGNTVAAHHPVLGEFTLHTEGAAAFLFSENETNVQRLFGVEGGSGFFKDAFHEFLVYGNTKALNPAQKGTKSAVHFPLTMAPGAEVKLRLRFGSGIKAAPFADFEEVLQARRQDTEEFYADLQRDLSDQDAKNIQRQALAGMIWSKQYFYYDVRDWLKGDPAQPPPPDARVNGRNHEWKHLNNADVVSMPDKWEYPWYAAWDLAFHTLSLALVDSQFAKRQLLLITQVWYMHPNGQLPAYEWAFGDVNPPVHGWATWRIFQIDRKYRRRQHPDDPGDLAFLETVFHKLMLNFTWWVNRKDAAGRNIFQGGFLGLDNIGVFDRSAPLPTGGYINQSDGTSWMAMYCLNLMRIALELATHDHVYEEIATKFFEHFLQIAEAMTDIGDGCGLWDESDGFYYDVLNLPSGQSMPLKVRSMVGLIPLFAVETLEPELLNPVPAFTKRLEWFLNYRPELAALVSRWQTPGAGARRLLSLLRGHRMKAVLRRMLDESEFLSDYGIRALSKYHLEHPYVFKWDGNTMTVNYEPGESTSGLFGGNSNWRGPIWFPVNYLIIESLQKFHHYYGDDFKIECPTGSGRYLTIEQVAAELGRRLLRLFTRDEKGRRPVLGQNDLLQSDPQFRDYLNFYEYFHGENGRGVGASHQTGWSGLIAKIIQPRAPAD